MIFTKEGSTTIITQERATIIELVANIEDKYDEIKGDNIIVKLFTVKDMNKSSVSDFLSISKKHKQSKKSFVIVSDKISYDNAPEELSITPTIQEAHDVIEMEEIERDLDF
jgi:hypothetical protein